jgi:TatD DNase family protein
MILTDTHSHLYDNKFAEDQKEVIERAFEEDVQRIFLPNVDQHTVKGMMDIVKQYPDKCFAMMGLHPCHVKADYKEELAVLKAHLDTDKFCAVGEIGMDLYWDKTFLEEQKDAFRTQIHWAKEKGLAIAIHCRDAFDEIFEILESESDEKLRGIFHCFTGSLEQAHQAINLNFYLGVGGVVTFKKAGLDKVIEQIDLKHLVLETDSPYLAPSPNRGKRNESSYLVHIAQKIADLHQVSIHAVAEITTENSKKIFGF